LAELSKLQRSGNIAGDDVHVDGLSAWVEVDSQGRVQLPSHLRDAAGLSAGATVHIRVSGDAIEILSQRAAVKRAHDIGQKFVPPGVSLVDELIAERRREAQKEEEGS
jgi:bifunctional DNA-binding transcriptional regulator/antitoxin component of YhaV-PrlF toxin-antitoxin module